jgi:hypothetical protein
MTRAILTLVAASSAPAQDSRSPAAAAPLVDVAGWRLQSGYMLQRSLGADP